MTRMTYTNVFSILAVLAFALSFTACGGDKGGGSTVAQVPANQCAQPGVNTGVGYAGYQGVSPYNYQGGGCAQGGVPTCYPNNGGLACIPQSAYQNVNSQGYNPMFYGYNQGQGNYGYQGYNAYGSASFAFNYNQGSYGNFPNQYVQGCRTDSYFSNSCGYGGTCRPILGGYGIGVCVRGY